MNINRNNYEEFFVLYIDNELNAADRAEVKSFLDANPDLKAELEMLEQAVLPAEVPVAFFNKEILYRTEANNLNGDAELVNETNCEEYFVLYADNELNNQDNALVEEFIYRHPQYQENFELIQQVKYQPEKHIVFPDKSILYRHERDSKVVPLFPVRRFWKMAAAAAVILMIGGTTWYTLNKNTGTGPANSGLATKNNDPKKNNSNSQLPATDTNNQIASAVDPASKKQSASSDQNTGTSKKNDNTGSISDQASSGKKALNNFADNKKQNKTDKTFQPSSASDKVINPTVKPIEEFAHNNSKKVSTDSNIPSASNVKQEKSNDNKQETKTLVEEKQQNLDETMALADTKTSSQNTVAVGPVQLPADNIFSKLANDNDEEFETSDKKNRARGFFRKVSRVLDKATSKEPAENRKSIHIASFSIPLN